MRALLRVLLLIVMVGSAMCGAMAKGRGALLVADRVSHDFGVIDSRSGDVHCTFVVTNRGDEPLVIERVVTSCSCTKANISRKPLAVGESRVMKVTYEVRKMPIGLFSKSILIFSTSRDDDMVRFTISGRSSYKHRDREE